MAGDANYDKVALLLHFDAPDGSTSIVDKSPTPKAVSVFAGAKISSARSMFGGSSLLLNGTTDYVQVPNANMYPATLAEDFTVEALIYITAVPAATMRLAGIADSGGGEMWSFGVTSSGVCYFNIYDGGFRQGVTGALPLNTWVHVAGVKSGSSVLAFAAGVKGPTVGAMTANPVFSNNPLSIGRMGNFNGQYFAGSVDDFRITKGVARYTANFTPPTQAFPDGMGQVSGTVKNSAGAAAARLLRAYRRSDGAQVGQQYSNAADADFNKVSILIAADLIANATAAIDSSNARRPLTFAGNAAYTTALGFFGTKGALVLDGSGDYITAPASPDFNLSAGDWTVELMLRLIAQTSGGAYLAHFYASSAERFAIQTTTAGGILLYSTTAAAVNISTQLAADGTLATGVDYHIAVTRQGTTIRVFVNGAPIYTGTPGNVITNTNCQFELGAAVFAGAAYLNGYLGQVRVTKGLARYTAAFTALSERHSDRTSGALGNYSFYTPTLDELTVLCLDDAAGTVENDLALRVIPA